MADKKTKLHSMLESNKFALAFSFVLAFVIWISVAMVFSPQTQRVIEDVPVKIVMENSVPEKFGLQLFGQTEFFVDVTITGKRYVVGAKNVNADSIEVIAETGYVDSAGKKTLDLRASLVDTTADYKIEAISADYIEAYFDEYKEAKFPIELKLDYDGEIISEGYIQGEPIITIDSETVKEVKITGAAQQINRIKNVFAYVELKEPLTETMVLDTEVVPTDEYGTSLKYIKINGEDTLNAIVTIPVLKTGELNTGVDFSGVPSMYVINPLQTDIYPARVVVGMPADTLEDTSVLTLDEIPFSSLDAKQNVFVFLKDDVENSNRKILDEVNEFKVLIDLSHLSKKKIEISTQNIELLNKDAAKDISFRNRTLTVDVVGPADALENITADDIIAQINLSNINMVDGVNEVEVKASLKNSVTSWVFGTYKTALLVK